MRLWTLLALGRWCLVAEHRPILLLRPQLAWRPLPAPSASSEMVRILFCQTERG